MKVLVTGGSGQLSSYLFEELASEHEAWGVDLREPTFDSAKGRITIADIRDQAAMLDACRGADAVVHTAAQVSVQRSTEDPAFDVETNVLGTVRTLKAARDAGVSKFVFISSAAAYGNPHYIPVDEDHPTAPLSVYGSSKLSAEHFVQAFGSSYGMRWAVLRPFNFYSPRADPKSPYSGVITKFTQNAASGLPLKIEGDGSQTRDFLHAADVARLVRLVLESDRSGLTLNGGSGQATSILDLAKTVKKVCPRPVDIEHVAPRTADIKHSVARVDRAREAVGFTTRISLEEGLKAFFRKDD
ncbi:MAG: NAD-dependent epimerase/dehydratase family protein [Methanomassiliicoccus sp.]|nr:NAD-dependent epimerase/dehydratase family protein [Methanomassiliicoccus sp.]